MEELIDLRAVRTEEPEESEEPRRLLPLTNGDEAAEYLTGVTTGRFPYDAGRVRAAQALLPHQRPKLAAMAVSSINGNDFAALLERAIARSREGPKQLELKANAARQLGSAHFVERAMNEREGLTIISQCSAGLTLVSDRVRSFEWISLPRREPRRARERLAPLKNWQSPREDKR